VDVKVCLKEVHELLLNKVPVFIVQISDVERTNESALKLFVTDFKKYNSTFLA
jgi:hypothetical protein